MSPVSNDLSELSKSWIEFISNEVLPDFILVIISPLKIIRYAGELGIT